MEAESCAALAAAAATIEALEERIGVMTLKEKTQIAHAASLDQEITQLQDGLLNSRSSVEELQVELQVELQTELELEEQLEELKAAKQKDEAAYQLEVQQLQAELDASKQTTVACLTRLEVQMQDCSRLETQVQQLKSDNSELDEEMNKALVQLAPTDHENQTHGADEADVKCKILAAELQMLSGDHEALFEEKHEAATAHAEQLSRLQQEHAASTQELEAAHETACTSLMNSMNELAASTHELEAAHEITCTSLINRMNELGLEKSNFEEQVVTLQIELQAELDLEQQLEELKADKQKDQQSASAEISRLQQDLSNMTSEANHEQEKDERSQLGIAGSGQADLELLDTIKPIEQELAQQVVRVRVLEEEKACLMEQLAALQHELKAEVEFEQQLEDLTVSEAELQDRCSVLQHTKQQLEYDLEQQTARTAAAEEELQEQTRDLEAHAGTIVSMEAAIQAGAEKAQLQDTIMLELVQEQHSREQQLREQQNCLQGQVAQTQGQQEVTGVDVTLLQAQLAQQQADAEESQISDLAEIRRVKAQLNELTPEHLVVDSQLKAANEKLGASEEQLSQMKQQKEEVQEECRALMAELEQVCAQHLQLAEQKTAEEDSRIDQHHELVQSLDTLRVEKIETEEVIVSLRVQLQTVREQSELHTADNMGTHGVLCETVQEEIARLQEVPRRRLELDLANLQKVHGELQEVMKQMKASRAEEQLKLREEVEDVKRQHSLEMDQLLDEMISIQIKKGAAETAALEKNEEAFVDGNRCQEVEPGPISQQVLEAVSQQKESSQQEHKQQLQGITAGRVAPDPLIEQLQPESDFAVEQFELAEAEMEAEEDRVELTRMPESTAVPAEKMADYLHGLFEIGDTNEDGVLSPVQFAKLLSQSAFNFSKDVIDELVRAADVNEDGVIEYNEFVPAMLRVLDWTSELADVVTEQEHIHAEPIEAGETSLLIQSAQLQALKEEHTALVEEKQQMVVMHAAQLNQQQQQSSQRICTMELMMEQMMDEMKHMEAELDASRTSRAEAEARCKVLKADLALLRKECMNSAAEDVDDLDEVMRSNDHLQEQHAAAVRKLETANENYLASEKERSEAVAAYTQEHTELLLTLGDISKVKVKCTRLEDELGALKQEKIALCDEKFHVEEACHKQLSELKQQLKQLECDTTEMSDRQSADNAQTHLQQVDAGDNFDIDPNFNNTVAAELQLIRQERDALIQESLETAAAHAQERLSLEKQLDESRRQASELEEECSMLAASLDDQASTQSQLEMLIDEKCTELGDQLHQLKTEHSALEKQKGDADQLHSHERAMLERELQVLREENGALQDDKHTISDDIS